MSETVPSLDQWKNIYGLALRFKQAAPWTWMTDDLLFGVQHPKTGKIGYCCVIGNLGEVFGLIVYKGAEGLASYRKLYEAMTPENNFDVFLSQDCLKLTFNDREETEAEDRQLFKNLDLKFRGRNAYPVFRNMSPGYYPWFITAEDAELLQIALEQAVDVCLRYRENKALLDAVPSGEYLVRTRDDREGSGAWHDSWSKPGPLPRAPIVSAVIDELRLRRIKSSAKRTTAIWEFDYAYADMPIQEQKADRPFFPLMLLIVDRESGFILDTTMAAPHSSRYELSERFIHVVEKNELLPREVHVAKDEAAAMLEPILSRFNAKLTKVKKCGEIEKARKEFETSRSRF